MTNTLSILYEVMDSDAFNRHTISQGGSSAMVAEYSMEYLTLAPGASYVVPAIANLLHIKADQLLVLTMGAVTLNIAAMLFLTGSLQSSVLSNSSTTATANILLVSS